MVSVPIAKFGRGVPKETCCAQDEESISNVGIAGGVALLLGGLLLLSGKRKAGTVVAASGVALTMIDQQELVKTWWNQLPGFIDHAEEALNQAQQTIDQVQGVVDEIAAKREKVRSMLHHSAPSKQ